MDIDNTNFPIAVTNKFKKLTKSYKKEKEFLKYHQYLTEKYLILQDGRGLLCYYETGQGKTYLAIAIAEHYRKLDGDRKIVILTAKSLASNFRDSLKTYMSKEEKMDDAASLDMISKHYKFISSNASNVLSQLENIRTDDTMVEVQNTIDRQLLEIQRTEKKYKGFLENSLIIVDEAHNMFNSISNGSKNAIGFYDMVLKTKDIKLLFLTGTPIINNPFELTGCFNMLYGFKFFPEIKQDFDNWFINQEKLKIKNRSKFSNFLVGKVSYYGSRYFAEKNQTQEGFPTQKPMNIIKVPMSAYQYSVYSNLRAIERKEASKGYKRESTFSRFGIDDKGSASSTYRVKSRQVSNFAFPNNILSEAKLEQEFLRKLKDKKEAQKKRKLIKYNMSKKLTDTELSSTLKTGLEKYSPKMLTMLQDIYKEHSKKKYKGIVYSGFVTAEGLGVFSKVLDVDGWTRFKPMKAVPVPKTGGRSKKYTQDDSLRAQWEAWEDTVPRATEVNQKYFDRILGGKKKAKKDKTKDSKSADAVLQAQRSRTKKQDRRTYAIISGDVHPDDRDHIVKVLNSEANMRGEQISLLLLSSTGAEGLDLQGIRFVQLMEGYWNYARIKQIIARGVRYRSHVHLPKDEQNVQPYIYLSDYPVGIRDTLSKEEPTTDFYIWKESLKNQILIDEFLSLLMEVSVDCQIHKNKIKDKKIRKTVKCKICTPTNKKLFYTSMTMQENIELPNPCKEEGDDSSSRAEASEQITAKELILDGDKKVYYTISDDDGMGILERIQVYEYNPELEAYMVMDDDHPLLPQILEKIVKMKRK